jgi:hypothetical protein
MGVATTLAAAWFVVPFIMCLLTMDLGDLADDLELVVPLDALSVARPRFIFVSFPVVVGRFTGFRVSDGRC